MRRQVLIALGFLVAVAVTLAGSLVAVPVLAASPHFIKTPTVSKNSDFSLTVKFKEAGLGNIVSGIFLSSSGGTADLQCVDPGGNNLPPFRFAPLQGQIVFIQPSNGQVTGSVNIGPPPLPSASEVCPDPDSSINILSLTYNNVVLHTQQQRSDILTFNFGNVDP